MIQAIETIIVLKHMCCVCVDVVHQATRASYEAAPQHAPDVDMVVTLLTFQLPMAWLKLVALQNMLLIVVT